MNHQAAERAVDSGDAQRAAAPPEAGPLPPPPKGLAPAFARADHSISTAGKGVAESTANILALIDDQAFF